MSSPGDSGFLVDAFRMVKRWAFLWRAQRRLGSVARRCGEPRLAPRRQARTWGTGRQCRPPADG